MATPETTTHRFSIWRKFQNGMVVFLALVVLAEGWRFFTSGNVHAFIDMILCGYIGAWTVHDLQ